jgi:hypothetical protein
MNGNGNGNGDLYKCLHKLELVICKVQSKRKPNNLCGNWKINFLQHNVKFSELKNLLFMYNLANMLRSPTRITNNTSSVIHVTINDNLNFERQTVIYDLVYSDHLGQAVYIKINKPILVLWLYSKDSLQITP